MQISDKVDTWMDVLLPVLLCIFAISGLIWGMKLEAENTRLQHQLDRIIGQVGNDTSLPRTEERVNALEREVDRLRAEMKDLAKESSNESRVWSNE